jgi:hypothetical protein
MSLNFESPNCKILLKKNTISKVMGYQNRGYIQLWFAQPLIGNPFLIVLYLSHKFMGCKVLTKVNMLVVNP